MVCVERTPYVEQRAELRVYGGEAGEELDPDEFSELIDVAPTKVWRRGEPRRSGRVREATLWWWETGDQVERDSERLVVQVLEKFEPVAGQLGQAKIRWGITLAVGLVVTMYVEAHEVDGAIEVAAATPALFFSAETLSRLARLGASLDADLYVDELDSAE